MPWPARGKEVEWRGVRRDGKNCNVAQAYARASRRRRGVVQDLADLLHLGRVQAARRECTKMRPDIVRLLAAEGERTDGDLAGVRFDGHGPGVALERHVEEHGVRPRPEGLHG